jgi:hypothetical protein
MCRAASGKLTIYYIDVNGLTSQFRAWFRNVGRTNGLGMKENHIGVLRRGCCVARSFFRSDCLTEKSRLRVSRLHHATRQETVLEAGTFHPRSSRHTLLAPHE